jgi:hypothetical protein
MTEQEATETEPRLDHEDVLRYGAVIPVLGIRATFESNHDRVLEIVDQAFHAWPTIEHSPRLISDTTVRVRVHVETADESTDGDHATIRVRTPDLPRTLIATHRSLGIADAARREALLYTTTGLIEDTHHFRHNVLEALTLAVLTRLDRMPLGAACITRGDTALLLAGSTGSGRSTLAYAAARAGYGVLSEDRVAVQLDPRLRLWGTPGWLYLPLDAADHFEELADREPDLLVNGTPRIAIRSDSLDALPAVPVAQRAAVCVLAPAKEDTPPLETLDGTALQEAMIAGLDPSADLFADTIGDSIAVLAGHGGWRLRTGPDPLAALDHIDAMFEVLADG